MATLVTDGVVAVTGGASGIGRALCLRFAAEGARAVAVVDRDGAGAEAVAAEVRAAGAAALPLAADVSVEAEVAALVGRIWQELGPVDLFCSNAGVFLSGGVEAANDDWERIWNVNVMSHVYAARSLLPRMQDRGTGHFLVTASAAGLLTQLGSAPYAVTKRAAVALAEWMAITYGGHGIGFSCLCPQGVRTPLLLEGVDQDDPAGAAVLAAGGLLEPEEVAAAVAEALAEDRFFVLPHPEVTDYLRRKTEDPDRWLRGMRRQWERLQGPAGGS